MPDTPLNPKPSPSARGRAGGLKSGAMGRKVGGFPLYVWGAGLLLAIGVGLYMRHRAANRGASPTSVAAPLEGSGGGGSSDGGGFTDTPFDSGFSDFGSGDVGSILGGISDLASLIGAGGFFPANGTTATGVPVATTPGASFPNAPTIQDTAPVYPTYSPTQFPPGTITSPPANIGSGPLTTDVSSGSGYKSGSGGRTPNYGLPKFVSGTFDMPPTPLPRDPVVIDPYQGPSYIEPGANTDLHVFIPPPDQPTLDAPVAAPGGGEFVAGSPTTGLGYGSNLAL